MPTPEQRLATLEAQMRRALATTAALQGQPADATLSVPHNDSWLFEDNVDGTHPANLRYVISANVQRVVSARLSIHLAPYRTYNTLSVSATGTESQGHSHGHSHTSPSHSHFLTVTGPASDPTIMINGGISNNGFSTSASLISSTIGPTNSTTPGATGSDSTGESATHTHNISASGVLGVTEGASPAGISISFDGVDATASLGGPFNADQLELNVLPFLLTTKSLWHTIALQPSGLGRIEAHLRLGVYVAAGSTF